MLVRLLLLLIVVPMVELALVLALGDLLGFQAALALIIASGILGAWLLKQQGWKIFRAIGRELSGGRLPSSELLDGVLIIVAGALLLTPGVLTDLLGIALLIPYSRAIFRRWLVLYLKSRWRLSKPGSTAAHDSQTIDSYVVPPQRDSQA